MKRNALVILCLAILFILTASLAFSQQEWEYPLEDWVFGDISAVDLENNRIVVSYISSDDQKKE
ncbi:MAG: hypothetical protein KKH80_04615, partial [Candidatus Omnitrophica bacterium]|nr:hypothetical protein [Candidatus Omnitrophota bacterium]